MCVCRISEELIAAFRNSLLILCCGPRDGNSLTDLDTGRDPKVNLFGVLATSLPVPYARATSTDVNGTLPPSRALRLYSIPVDF